MRPEIVLLAIPNPDPDFMDVMLGLPEPDKGMEERISRVLPKLHKIFLLKKQAVQAGDREELMRLVEEEAAAIGEL